VIAVHQARLAVESEARTDANQTRKRPADVDSIRQVNRLAFGGDDEPQIVDRVRDSADPIVSLVADDDGGVVGHILFSPVTLGHGNARLLMGLGPVAVLPARQRQGIGSALVLAGLEECRRFGAAGRVVVGDLPSAVEASDVIMVAVGTPSAPSGALDLTAVTRVCDQIGQLLPDDRRFRAIVIRSTVLPGTIDDLVRPTLEAASGRTAGTTFGIATNPEFLREGSSIRDFFEASRTIVGSDDDRTADLVERVYEGLEVPVHRVSMRTAEMIKYTDNAFHALKIAFANEIGSFARASGVDGREVMRLMTADHRLNISPVYLRPGYAFGGSCLPKDLRAITDRARKSDLDLPLLHSALQSNTAHFERGVSLVESIRGRDVALLGLSFKSSTDDLRESPAVALAERLIGRGYRLAIYDEDVQPEDLRGANRAFIDERLPHVGELLRESLPVALSGREIVVVTKHTPALEAVPELLDDSQTVIDFVGVPWADRVPAERYHGIAW